MREGLPPARSVGFFVGGTDRLLLLVALDLADRPWLREVRVSACRKPGPALPQQVPALVQRDLQPCQPIVFLLLGQVALCPPLAQLVFLVHQLVNAIEDLFVTHWISLSSY